VAKGSGGLGTGCGGARLRAAALAGRLAGVGKNRTAVHQTARGKHQNEGEDKWTSLSSLKGKKRRRRSGSAAGAELRFGFPGGGGVEGERSSIERCGVERSSGAAFYRWRGERRGRGRGGGRRAWRRPPLMASGSVGGRFRGEEGTGSVWAAWWSAAAHLEGGEAARGGEGAPGRAAAGGAGERGRPAAG
jgi:hypothetical protein